MTSETKTPETKSTKAPELPSETMITVVASDGNSLRLPLESIQQVDSPFARILVRSLSLDSKTGKVMEGATVKVNIDYPALKMFKYWLKHGRISYYFDEIELLDLSRANGYESIDGFLVFLFGGMPEEYDDDNGDDNGEEDYHEECYCQPGYTCLFCSEAQEEQGFQRSDDDYDYDEFYD
jgi:hypothetical protein